MKYLYFKSNHIPNNKKEEYKRLTCYRGVGDPALGVVSCAITLMQHMKPQL